MLNEVKWPHPGHLGTSLASRINYFANAEILRASGAQNDNNLLRNCLGNTSDDRFFAVFAPNASQHPRNLTQGRVLVHSVKKERH
jgi:hypothetical protein